MTAAILCKLPNTVHVYSPRSMVHIVGPNDLAKRFTLVYRHRLLISAFTCNVVLERALFECVVFVHFQVLQVA